MKTSQIVKRLFQTISKTPEATEGPEIWSRYFQSFFDDFKICVAPENKGDVRVVYAVPQVALNSRGSLDVGWDMTDHRKRGAPSGSVPSSRPRQRSRPTSDREEILQRMKVAAVILFVLSTVVTSVVVHRCLLGSILERNEYYAREKRERENNRGVTENFVFVSCGTTAVQLERHEKIRNIFCGTYISFSAYWLLTRKKLLRALYTVANPARGLLNREKTDFSLKNIVQLD